MSKKRKILIKIEGASCVGKTSFALFLTQLLQNNGVSVAYDGSKTMSSLWKHNKEKINDIAEKIDLNNFKVVVDDNFDSYEKNKNYWSTIGYYKLNDNDEAVIIEDYPFK